MEIAKDDAKQTAASATQSWEVGSIETAETVISLDSDCDDEIPTFFGRHSWEGVIAGELEESEEEEAGEDEQSAVVADELPPRFKQSAVADELPPRFKQRYGCRKGVDGTMNRRDIDEAFKIATLQRWDVLVAENTVKGKLKHGTFTQLAEWVHKQSNGRYKVCNRHQLDAWRVRKDHLKVSKKRFRCAGGGRKVQVEAGEARMLGFVRGLRFANSRVTVLMLLEESAVVFGTKRSQGWASKFMARNKLRVRTAKRASIKTDAEVSDALNRFYNLISGVLAANICKVVVNFDEVPMSLSGSMGRNFRGIVEESGKHSTTSFDAADTKRMSTVILGAAVEISTWLSFPLTPFILLKGRPKQQRVLDERYHPQVRVAWTDCGVINLRFMREYVRYLRSEINKFQNGAICMLVLDSARSHISPSIIDCFQQNGFVPVCVPGGCTPLVQFVDTDVAACYRAHHTKLYFAETPTARKRSSKMKRHLFAALVAEAWSETLHATDVAAAFDRLGYFDPNFAAPRTKEPFVFVPDGAAPTNVQALIDAAVAKGEADAVALVAQPAASAPPLATAKKKIGRPKYPPLPANYGGSLNNFVFRIPKLDGQ